MTTVLANSLSDKPVLGTDGTELGTVYNITMHPESGNLDAVLVDPASQTLSTEFDTTEEGQLRIPAQRVQNVRDYLVVDNL